MFTEILFIVLILLMLFYMNCGNKEYFAMSNKPMDHDWNLFNNNPFDEVDYITPVFKKI